uniref:uncharacterized protein LOC122606278 n=1 Tax=Erigeron canadensis TaxID=72917 RepID=UPI001CB9AD2A|nr:uncharacterized protein LOC122606278 [Erigeron canadensis]
MADQNSIDNNISNNKSVKDIPLTRAEYLKSKFAVTPESLANYFLKESIRRCEEREKRRQEGSYDSDEECDEEEYKPFFRNKVDCLVKPPCGHDAWVRYQNKLALKEAAAAAAAACHDDDVDAPGGPKKKLKGVNEQKALEGTWSRDDNVHSESGRFRDGSLTT